jgi:exostosin family protein
MLAPFWGKNPEDPNDPDAGRFDEYMAVGSRFLELTTLEDADVAVFPLDWSSIGQDAGMEAAHRFIESAQAAGTPSIVFFNSDSAKQLPVEATAVVRTSLHRSRRGPNDFAQPGWSEDFVPRYLGNELVIRRKAAKPVVGFCGLVPRSPFSPARRVRGGALRSLERDPAVETNFRRKRSFLGGALSQGTFETSARQAREEYVHNLVESDYVLCARGAGNFSYRLYETLSCGRIPLFVDTDCVLPYDFVVDWRDFCVWVDEAELDRAGEIVAEFHERLTDTEFEDLQRSCRRFWEEYIRPVGFFSNFHRIATTLGEPVAS